MTKNPLRAQLTAQFYRGNLGYLMLALLAALAGGSLNLILSWLMQQLIDAASGVRGHWGSARWQGFRAGFWRCMWR